jgi:hypothetical protein
MPEYLFELIKEKPAAKITAGFNLQVKLIALYNMNYIERSV